MRWRYKDFIALHKRYDDEADAACQMVLERLREFGGPLWKGKMCQADIIRIAVATTREYYLTNPDKLPDNT